jgi:hypothetical protein
MCMAMQPVVDDCCTSRSTSNCNRNCNSTALSTAHSSSRALCRANEHSPVNGRMHSKIPHVCEGRNTPHHAVLRHAHIKKFYTEFLLPPSLTHSLTTNTHRPKPTPHYILGSAPTSVDMGATSWWSLSCSQICASASCLLARDAGRHRAIKQDQERR